MVIAKPHRVVATPRAVAALLPLVAAVAAMLTAGCGTVVAPLPQSAGPSYDGAALNSGVIAWVPGGELVTPHWRDRYNGMIALYGARFLPPVRPDDGLVPASPGNAATQFFVDNEHVEKFVLMNTWRKQDAAKAPGKAAP